MTTYQFASNQPIHANEIEGLENEDDKSLMNRTTNPVVQELGAATKLVPYVPKAPMEVVRETTKEIAKEGAKKAPWLKNLVKVGKLFGFIAGMLSPGELASSTRYDEEGRDKSHPNYPNVPKTGEYDPEYVRSLNLNLDKDLKVDEELKIDDVEVEKIDGDTDSAIVRLGNQKDGGKTGKKINQKRKQSWVDKEADAKKRLAEAKKNGATKKEKAKIQKEIDHARRKQKASENHANKGQGY